MLATRVSVVRGGPSSEYEVSMATGTGVIAALKDLGYNVTDITVSKRGEWLVNGLVKSPDKALMTTDVVFIAMHGAYGEDGTIQRICERLHIPFTGSNSFPSSLAFNKDATKRALVSHGIQTPKHVKVTKKMTEDLDGLVYLIKNSFGPEYVLKPTNSGSSHGIKMVPTAAHLGMAILEMVEQDIDEFMIEERIRGKEATCAILENFRNQPLYVLPAIEIIPPDTHDFFAADVKYTGATTELVPGRFSYDEKDMIASMATTVHAALGLTQYSRSDFMVRDGEVYFLEVNTLPGLTSQSLFPKAAEAVGLSFPGLIDHLVKTARV
jgi:D-alanine-D-alanine ligase